MSVFVFVQCDKFTTARVPECPEPSIELKLEGDRIEPADIEKILAEHGWGSAAGKHYCPRHHPTEAGIPFEPPVPDGAYHPIANSGWEARASMGTRWLEVRPIRQEAA